MKIHVTHNDEIVDVEGKVLVAFVIDPVDPAGEDAAVASICIGTGSIARTLTLSAKGLGVLANQMCITNETDPLIMAIGMMQRLKDGICADGDEFTVEKAETHKMEEDNETAP